MRTFNRQARKLGMRAPAQLNPRTLPRPRVFGTTDGPFPFEFDGWGPQPGDAVERYGSVTVYDALPAVQAPAWIAREVAPDAVLFMSVHAASGAVHLRSAGAAQTAGRTVWCSIAPDGSWDVGYGNPFDQAGVSWHWLTEMIRHVLPDGREYTWEAPLCVPATVRENVTLWTPEYRAKSEANRRINASTARHVRRERMTGPDGQIERIDPWEVYSASGWLCQLCGALVDPSLQHPDPMSASLDHRRPLAAGGRHRRDNVQLAHLLCNMRKGARDA